MVKRYLVKSGNKANNLHDLISILTRKTGMVASTCSLVITYEQNCSVQVMNSVQFATN